MTNEATPPKRTSAEAAKALIATGGKAPDMQDIPRRRPETDESSAIQSMKRLQEAREKHAAEAARLDAEEAAIHEKFMAEILVQLQAARITPETFFAYCQSKTKAKASAGTRKTKSDKPAKYRNELGQTWTGFGKRPAWLVDALKQPNAKLEDFRVTA